MRGADPGVTTLGGLVIDVTKNWAGYRITNLASPTEDTDAARWWEIQIEASARASVDATKVGLTGNETVADIKTFSSIPVLPASDPTTDNQAVRKAYADAFIVGGGRKLVIVRKSADETVNNSIALHNDDALTFAIAANEVWRVDLLLLFDSSVVADIKLGWAYPAGCGIKWAASYPLPVVVFTEASTPMLPGAGVGSICMMIISAIVINGGTAGSITLMWAQNTAEATNTIVRANSAMLAFKLA